MKRQDFLKAAIGWGIAGGAAGPAKAGRCPASQESEDDPHKTFKDAWISALMDNLEKTVDLETRTRLMTDCGRACARRSGGLLRAAEACRGDAARFVETVGGKVGPGLCRIDGDVIHWGYPRCYCELVADGPDRLPDTYCLCSAGWVREMFGIVLGEPVRVDIVQSVKRGAPDCRFIVQTA